MDAMTLDKWITLIASIASMLSAIFAACAIYQAVQQRKSSYKPQIVIDNLLFKGQCTQENYFDNQILSAGLHNELSIGVINAGVGSAVNIKYQWLFPLKKFTNQLHKKLANLNNATDSNDDPNKYWFKYNFEENENEIRFNLRSPFKAMPHIISKKEHSIQCFLPYSVTKEATPITLKTLPLVLILNDLLLDIKSGSKESSPPGPTLVLSYRDIGGSHITEHFKTRVTIVDFKFDMGLVRFFGKLEFEKIKKSRTSNGIERIRKSYVDFMDKHDYNKNR